MKLFALADCNNFYCSCERIFQPRLRGVPVVVLSNNDGCVIARSEEAKALGIPMGAPEFKIRELTRRHGVRMFSSNYTLYGDISARVMQVLANEAPETEIYSIDECFLDLSGIREPAAHAIRVRAKVKQWTDIPISIGIASTKTLAKAANKLAKKTREGVLLLDAHNADGWLEQLPVEKVWGIGRQHTKRLNGRQIFTARELKNADRGWVRKEMGVVGERIVLELQGVSCLEFEEPEAKKNIACAKSFGHPLGELEEIAEALACYTNRVSEKLRAQKSVATAMQVFLMTNPHRPDQPQYCAQKTMTLPEASDYTPVLLIYARWLLEKIYKPGFLYRKVGVMLLDLCHARQLDLFAGVNRTAARTRLQAAVDELGGRVRWGSMGFGEDWELRAEHRSRRFTTDWDELPIVRAA